MTRVALAYHPRDWQRHCHRRLRRFSVLALHRRAGKTELAIMHLLDRALGFRLELGTFFYIAPYLKQAKTIAWARLKQRIAPLRAHGGVEVNETELTVRFTHNGATVRVLGADNPDALRGVRLDGVVIDEVADVKPEVWDDIVQPALSDRKGWALFIGTPHGVNLFSALYHRARSLPDWFCARYTVYDTQSLDADEVTQLKRDMSEVSFAREYLCDFAAAGDDQLLSLSDIEAAAQRVHPAADIVYSPRIIGVDPARFGDDRSVIIRRQGLCALAPRAFRGMDNMTLAARVAQTISDWQPDAVFIDEGAGSGVIDRLRQLGYDVAGVHFSGRASASGYLNKRAEMWFAMRDWLKGGGAIPNLEALKSDLAATRFWFDAQGRRQLEAKEAIKKRGLPSPDLGDALALTFAMPVAAKTPLSPPLPRPAKYDPYAGI